MRKPKKLAGVIMSLVLATALAIPTLSFATATTDSESAVPTAPDSAMQHVHESSASFHHQGETAVGNCTATIKYYENATWLEPGYEPNEDGRYFMGERVITGLSEGDVLDAWDYVVDIEGFFFFDGWPAKLTITSNPDDNVIELFYFREWSSEYTVNYYMMVGADLTADTWAGALAPSDVEFIKFDSEVFENQPYGMLVEGDAYEYRLDGKYVVDSYPPEIRVGSDADNNVLNVLYVPDSTHLPDDFEIPDDVFSVEGGANGGASNGSGSTGTGPGSTLPDDETFGRDEIEGLLPDGLTTDEIDDLFKDFIGSQADSGRLEITDEMLANPVDREEAAERVAAYRAGLEQGDDQASAQEAQVAEESGCDHLLCILIIILLLILCIIGYVLYGRERKLRAELQEQLDHTPSEQVKVP